MKRDWMWRAIAVVVGIIVGWQANNYFGSRYVFHAPEGGRFRIDSRTGKTWRLMDGKWTPVGER